MGIHLCLPFGLAAESVGVPQTLTVRRREALFHAHRYARMVDAMEIPIDDATQCPCCGGGGEVNVKHGPACKEEIGRLANLGKQFAWMEDHPNIVRQLKENAADEAAEAARERERATEWEGIAAGRLAALGDARKEAQENWDSLIEEKRFRIDLQFRVAEVEKENARLVDDHIKDTNEIGTLAAVLVEDLGEKSTGESVCVGAARLLLGDKERITLLNQTLRFILRVDKTPAYGYQGTKADRDRHGQLPKKSGQRWKTPRELIRDLKLPAE